MDTLPVVKGKGFNTAGLTNPIGIL